MLRNAQCPGGHEAPYEARRSAAAADAATHEPTDCELVKPEPATARSSRRRTDVKS